MFHWINGHGIECLVAYWVFAAAVGSMREATAESSAFYQWLYGFSHGILQLMAANLDRVPGLGALIKQGVGSSAQRTAPPSPPDTNKPN